MLKFFSLVFSVADILDMSQGGFLLSEYGLPQQRLLPG